jgi:hypothetical protein
MRGLLLAFVAPLLLSLVTSRHGWAEILSDSVLRHANIVLYRGQALGDSF